MLTPDKDLITKFSAIVGEKYAITDRLRCTAPRARRCKGKDCECDS
jgi:hypothetical protein